MVPHPVDTQVSIENLYRLEILFNNGIHVIYKNMHTKFSIKCDTVYEKYILSRWDNIGGWREIITDKFENIEQAKNAFLPITKYFL